MQRKQICLCLLGSVISKLCIASVSQRILPRYPYLHKKVHKKSFDLHENQLYTENSFSYDLFYTYRSKELGNGQFP